MAGMGGALGQMLCACDVMELQMPPHRCQLWWGLVPFWQVFAKVTAHRGTFGMTWWPEAGPL